MAAPTSKHTPVTCADGQDMYRFDNDYGASVIDLPYDRGRELAILWFEDGAQRPHLVHNDLVPDVARIRDEQHLAELLDKIAALPR